MTTYIPQLIEYQATDRAMHRDSLKATIDVIVEQEYHRVHASDIVSDFVGRIKNKVEDRFSSYRLYGKRKKRGFLSKILSRLFYPFIRSYTEVKDRKAIYEAFVKDYSRAGLQNAPLNRLNLTVRCVRKSTDKETKTARYRVFIEAYGASDLVSRINDTIMPFPVI